MRNFAYKSQALTLLSSAESVGLVGLVMLSVCAFAVGTAQSSEQTQTMARPDNAVIASTFTGKFESVSQSYSELDRLLRGKGAEIDLAEANWLVAADIPEFHTLTRGDYFKELDALTGQVRQEMAKMQKVAAGRGENLNGPKTRCAIFCNAIIKLRFAYREEFRQEKVTTALLKSLYADPDNICLAGLLRTRRGSCVSMPLIYLVIGQRLGMPVHLVSIGRHYFIRWEEPGFRINIEPTIVDRVSVTPDNSVYLEIEGITREQVRGSDLRNLTPREVVGHLLFARSGYWAAKGSNHLTQQRRDLALARELAPEDDGITRSYAAVFKRGGGSNSSTARSNLK